MPIQLAYALDDGYLDTTSVSLFSALRHLSQPVDIHVFHSSLSKTGQDQLANIVAMYSHATLNFHDLDVVRLGEFDECRDAPAVKYVSAATCGRLVIPSHLSGRVIYLDGDTLVLRDLAPLNALDLAGQPLGACPAINVMEDALLGARPAPRFAKHHKKPKGAFANSVLSQFPSIPAEKYFNAGVLVLECDAIRNDPAFADLSDFKRCGKYFLLDQDWLNVLFEGRVFYLPAEWNSMNGNVATEKDPFPPEMQMACRTSRENPAILHYLGYRKPWAKAPLFRRHYRGPWRNEFQGERRMLEKALGIRLFAT